MANKGYKFKIDTKDMEKTVNKINGNMDLFLKNLITKLGLMLLARTKRLTPVVTGLLRRSWRLGKPKVKKGATEIEISNQVKYALPVEKGRKKPNGGFVPGKFMLRNAFAELEPKIKNIAEQELDEYIRRNGG